VLESEHSLATNVLFKPVSLKYFLALFASSQATMLGEKELPHMIVFESDVASSAVIERS
jgi:hypothetical protein